MWFESRDHVTNVVGWKSVLIDSLAFLQRTCIIGNEMKRFMDNAPAFVSLINAFPCSAIVLRWVISQRDLWSRQINFPDPTGPNLTWTRGRFHRSSRACNILLFTSRCLDIVDHILSFFTASMYCSVYRCADDICFAPTLFSGQSGCFLGSQKDVCGF